MTSLGVRRRFAPDGTWVDAQPFRAHLQHLSESTGADWRTIASIAHIPPAVAERLMFGRSGRPVRRISPDNAWRLYRITPRRLTRLMASRSTREQSTREQSAREQSTHEQSTHDAGTATVPQSHAA